ncbi:nucleotide-sugar transporter-domain-containing protein [Umbelopsis sp. PMI_123]|nr:nucleotide-sugar transporter-domain-containing protein [Umbelopsis sp. PMI_123]
MVSETLSLWGIPLKYLSLLVLVVQNSALILVMRYTRASASEDQLYLASTAVVMSEVMKALVCIALLYFALPPSKRSLKKLARNLNRELIVQWRETLKLSIPAGLYLIQNNLQYLAVSNLDAATFQVTYQLKIITTAFFSVIILRRSLNKLKWIAITLLTIGIALVVLPRNATLSTFGSFLSQTTLSDDRSDDMEDAADSVGNQSNIKGYVAVLLACFLSGLAGVYFEKILKSPVVKPQPKYTRFESVGDKELGEDANSRKSSVELDEEDPVSGIEDDGVPQSAQVWVRNIQMSLFSMLFGLVFVVGIQDGRKVATDGFFAHYNILTWVVISIQAIGGLIVALVVKYADNILKGFATSISIILSTLVSVWIFNFIISGPFVLGAALVIFATRLYGM